MYPTDTGFHFLIPIPHSFIQQFLIEYSYGPSFEPQPGATKMNESSGYPQSAREDSIYQILIVIVG